MKSNKKTQLSFIKLNSLEDSISSVVSLKKRQKEIISKRISKEKPEKTYNAFKPNIGTMIITGITSMVLLNKTGGYFLKETKKNIPVREIAIEPDIIKSQLETDFTVSGKEAEILHRNLEHPSSDRVKIREKTLKEALEIYQKNSKNI